MSRRMRFDDDDSRFNDPAEMRRYILEYLWNLWEETGMSRQVVDDESQRNYIALNQVKYVYPDYRELVGEPSPDDYTPEGRLTYKRITELMLIGSFDWRGRIIAKHPSVFGFSYWKGKRWEEKDKGWYVALEPLPTEFSTRNFFTPLRHVKTQRLERYLLERKKPLGPAIRIEPFDGNRYNCHPSNLDVYSARGRPMKCVQCQQRTTKERSVRFKVDGIYQRYCRACMQAMGEWFAEYYEDEYEDD